MKSTYFTSDIKGDIAAGIAGAITPLAYAPYDYYPLALFTTSLLLFLRLTLSPRAAFRRSFFYGVGLFGVGASWIYHAIYVYGNAPVSLSLVITAAFVFYLALFPALQGYVQARFFPGNKPTYLLFAFPATWVLQEGLRGWFISGFPWLLLGQSQITSPLRGLYPIVGDLGVSFAVAFSSALIVLLFISRKKPKIIASFFLLWGSAYFLSTVTWTHPVGKPLSVALIQGNIPQQLKWDPTYLNHTLNTYVGLTFTNKKQEVIIWPEAAVPLPLPQAQPFINSLKKEVSKHSFALILGIPIKKENSEAYFNSLMVLGQGEGLYHKRHLVPFGEYIPFENIFGPVLDFLHIPMSDLTNGSADQPLPSIFHIPFAAFICYEIAYEHLVLPQLDKSQFIVVINNDAWFGNSLGPWQQFEIARIRALQTGRFVLFASNDGITAIINPEGKIQTSLPQFQTLVLTGSVQPYLGSTPWMWWGQWPVLLGSLLIVFLLLNNHSVHKDKQNKT